MNHFQNEVLTVNGTNYLTLEPSYVDSCKKGDPIQLLREPKNPYDCNAIKVLHSGIHIGYIPRKIAGSRLAHILDENRAYIAHLEKVSPANKKQVYKITLTTFSLPAEHRVSRANQVSSLRKVHGPIFRQNHDKAVIRARGRCGIYRIECKNEKSYIGQSINIGNRWRQHITSLNKGFHDNVKLQSDWSKLGYKKFKFHIVEECCEDKLDDKELFYIQEFNSYKSGYNATPDGQSLIQKHESEKPADSVISSGIDSEQSFSEMMKSVHKNIAPVAEAENLKAQVMSENNINYSLTKQSSEKCDSVSKDVVQKPIRGYFNQLGKVQDSYEWKRKERQKMKAKIEASLQLNKERRRAALIGQEDDSNRNDGSRQKLFHKVVAFCILSTMLCFLLLYKLTV